MQLPKSIVRPTRLRKTASLRAMLQETYITTQKLIQPLFIHAGINKKQEIPSMPGQFQLSLRDLESEVHELVTLNIPAVILFGIPKYKDSHGSESYNPNGIIQQAIKIIKACAPELIIIADLCLCEYTDHGHCGILDPSNKAVKIDNAATLEAYAKQAISLAKAGADWIAPSGMADGMVAAIRTALDTHGFVDTAILSYAVKYASSLYGPFRQAAEGAPKSGDRKTYQMNPANSAEAILEAKIDIAEGADLIMIKPAGLYGDIIYKIKQQFSEIPLCAYQVSGEYSMIKLAGESNILNAKALMHESLIAIIRAGADLVITYFAKEFARDFYENSSNS